MEILNILKQKGSKVWSAHVEDTVGEALKMLVEQKIGALLVLGDGDKIAGVISERDIMRLCHHKPDKFQSMKVKDVMTKKVIVASAHDSVDYVMGIMTHNRVRHVPILADEKLEGLVSIGDVVKAQLQETSYENRYLREYMFGGNLEDEQE